MKPARRPRSCTPRLETLEIRALPSVAPPAELSESNASAWKTFAADGKSATVKDDTSKVMVGGKSLRFDTLSGKDTGIKLLAGAQAWDLSTYKQLEFWTFAVNSNSGGFEGAQPVVVLTTTTGTYRYTPRNQPDFTANRWDKHHITLAGDAFWSRTTTGTPNLSNVTGIEIHQDTVGAGFTVYYDGVRFTKTDPTATSSVTPSSTQGGVSPRVVLYVLNPVLENKGGKRLNEAYGYSDGRVLASAAMQDIKAVSNGMYLPQVVETRVLDQHAYFTDGFQYTDQTYASAQAGNSYHNGSFDYARLLRENGLTARVDRGEIDEVWIYGGPGMGLYEVVAAGKGSSYLRGPAVSAGERVFPIMGLDYAKSTGDALLAFAHRVEATMARVYQPLSSDANNAWKKFTRTNRDAAGQGGVGSADVPVNGRWGGDYDYRTAVQSTAADWERYPALTGAKTSVNSDAWSPSHSDPKRDYLKWWLDRLPDVAGRAADGRLSNWWRYVADLDSFKDNLDMHGSDASGVLTVTGVSANTTLNGTVDVGTSVVLDGVLGRVDLYVDGVLHSGDTLAPFTFRLDTSKLSGGSHTLQARGYEVGSNAEIRSANVAFSVAAANVAPTLEAIAGQAVSEGGTLRFTAKASDANAGQKLTFTISGGPTGATIDANTGAFSWAAADGPLTTSVVVRVTDAGGLSDSQAVQLTVRNEPPTARLVSSGTLTPGSPVTFAFQDVTDPSAADRAAGYKYSFDWNNDGDFADAGEVSDGTAPSAQRTFAAAGTYTVHGRVKDKNGGATDYRVNVIIASAANVAPTLEAIAGQAVSEGGTLRFTAKASDANAGQKLTFTISGGPTGATIDANTGAFSWAAADGPLTTSVVVRVTDAGGLSDSQAVQLTVRNEAPTARLVSSGTLTPGSPVTFAFQDVTDPSAADRAAGYKYSFDWNNDGDFADAGEANDGTAPSAQRTFAAAGTYTVHGRVKDKNGGAADYRVTVVVSAANSAPVLASIGTQAVGEGGTLRFTAKASDANAGQKLTFTISGGPTGATIDANTGAFSWAAADGPLTTSVVVRVTDAGGLSDSQAVQLTVRNEAPTARLVSSGTLTPGSPVTFAFQDVTDPSAADRAAGYKYSFDWNNDGDFADAGEVSDGTAPSAQRTFAAAGTYTVHGRVKDKNGGAADYTTSVTIAAVTTPTPGAGRVSDLAPGSASSSPTQLIGIGRTLYFAATTPNTGEELFKSDGTAAGTVLVRDITAGKGGSLPRNLTNVNGILYFTAQDETHGVELWRSDGSAAGTYMVKDINPGTASGWPNRLFALNGVLYFTAYTSATGVELWRSDGTEAGTQLVIDLTPGTGSGSPDQFTPIGNGLAFVGNRPDVGSELFYTGGSAATTVVIKDINPGRNSSFIAGMINSAGYLYFSAYTPTFGEELWRSDLTPNGTYMIKDIAPGSEGSSPSEMIAFGAKVIFSANDNVSGNEPWITDGTAGGTRLLADIIPGLGSSAPTSMVVYNGAVYFSAGHDAVGVELWRTDGTTAGTRLVTDIQPGTSSSTPENLVVSGGYLWFTAWTASKGVEVWRTDGTAGNSKSLATLKGVKVSWPSALTDAGGAVFFVGFDSGTGYELWWTGR